MSQQWKYAIIMVLHKKKDRTECDNYMGISLVARAGKILLKINPRRLSDSVDRTVLWPVLARFVVPQNVISVIRQFHNDMRVCVQVGVVLCSGWFAVEQGLRQGCVLAPLLFNIFFATVINVAYTHFSADRDTVDALVHL